MMNYNYQGFQNYGEPLTAEQLIKMEDALVNHSKALETCISSQPSTGWEEIDSSNWVVTAKYFWSVNHTQTGPHDTWEYITLNVTPGEVY